MASGSVTAGQVYQEVLSQGGGQTQAQVAAALVSGIESNGELDDQNPTSTASGLFQFLDTTWGNYDGVARAGEATLQQQVGKFIQESGGPGGNNFYAWAPDLGGSYNGSGTYTQIGGKVAEVIGQDSASWGAAAPATNMTQADWQALSAADQVPGGRAYLAAANAQAQSAAAQAATGTASGSTTGTAASTGGTPGDTSTEGSAYTTVVQSLDQYGLGQLAPWAWSEITAGKNSDQILLDLQGTGAAPGTPLAAAQATWQASIFGTVGNARNAAGLAPMTPAEILSYQDTAQQMSQAAGMPQGTINQQVLTNLMGNDVSTQELSQRISQGYQAAMNAPQETRNLLSQYFGVNTGDLAAYYLNPANSQTLLQNQQVAAEAGSQAAQSGFGVLTAANATALAQNLAAQGKVSPATTTSAGTWNPDLSSTFATLAPLAGLENAMPGMGNAAPSVDQAQLLAYGFLSKGQENVQRAVETRKAFASGGGGEDITEAGVTGVGNASSQGTKQQQEAYG